MKDLLRLLRLFRPYSRWMALGVFLSFLTLIANMGLMAISGWFIAAMALAGIAGHSMNYFTPAAMIRGLAITRTVGRYLERLVTHEATFRLLSSLRVWFYERLEPLAPSGLQDRAGGDLLSRIRADIDTLENFYLRFLVPVLAALFVLPLVAGLVALYSGKLATGLVVLLVLAGLVIPLLVQARSQEQARAQVETAALLRTHLAEGQSGLSELIMAGQWDAHYDRISRLSTQLIADQKRLSNWEGLSQGMVVLLANSAVWLALFFLIPQVDHRLMTGPDLPMLVLLSMASFEMVMPLPLAFRTLPQVLAAASRIFEIADAKAQIMDPGNPLPAPTTGNLQIRDLVFAYGETAAPVLNGLDLDLSPGRKVALVGATGSGKSSTVNALVRFWERRAGSIQLDGQDIARYAQADLRAAMSVMPQHVHLFNTTIRANLLVACPDADEPSLLAACKTAGLEEFINRAEQGLDTFVGEAGMKVSGGQARRIGLARALLKPAPVLILDEPFEGLDGKLARQVMHNILDACTNRSLLLISHLPHGLADMDEVIMLDHGVVVERGSHAELMAQRGAYFDLQDRLG